MAERKVLNKYYPPDFDPSLIPKAKKPKNDKMNVRMMVPMSIQCNTCGEYIYKGKKFNAKKETIKDEEYLGMKIFRFYFRCPRCSSELTIKTDPKNADYAAEFGVSRNFEPWRRTEEEKEEEKKERELEEEGDTMKALENRTEESKIEMDILDALDEMKQVNARLQNVNTDKLLEQLKEKNKGNTKGNALDKEEQKELEVARRKRARALVKKVEEKKDTQTFFAVPGAKKQSNIVKKPRKSRFVVRNKKGEEEKEGKKKGNTSNSGNDNSNETVVSGLSGLLGY